MFMLVLLGLIVGFIFLWWQPVQPAGVVAILASTPFLALARALHPWAEGEQRPVPGEW
jgi:hypothetical protein